MGECATRTALVGLRPDPYGLGHSATIDFRKDDAMKYGSTLNTSAIIAMLWLAFMAGAPELAFAVASLLAMAWAFLADLWREVRRMDIPPGNVVGIQEVAELGGD